jgi:hypothetical protein
MTKIEVDLKSATDEHGESSNMTGKVVICITVILFLWITGLLFWVFVLRDTWEVDNSQKIINMTNEIKALDQTNKKEEAVAKYEELLLVLGNRKIKTSAISKLISDANATIYDTRRKLNAEKTLALIEDFEENAKALTSNEKFSDATKKYVEALNYIENCGIDSPELNIIKKRILDNKQFTEEKEHQRQLVELHEQQETLEKEHQRQLTELHEQQETLRQIEAKENAQKMIDGIISNLPSLQSSLQADIRTNMLSWVGWQLGLSLRKEGEEKDPTKNTLSITDVIKRIHAVDANTSPLLVAYQDEILNIIECVGWSNYGNSDKSNSKYIPLHFAVHQNQLVIILGTIFSETVFNNINSSIITPKKRAAFFIQSDVLPTLLKTRLPEKLKEDRFGYLGILFIYGNKNFIEKELFSSPEVLGIVMSTRDLVDFINRDLSQEAFLKKSSVFIASPDRQSVYIASETPQLIKVEITLE